MKKPKIEVVIRNYSQFEKWCLKWSTNDFESDPRSIISRRFIHRQTRTQENTINMLIRRLAEHTGNDFDALRHYFKVHHGPSEPGYKGEDTPKSFADYDIEEAGIMIDAVLREAASLPSPLILEIEDK